MSPKVPRLYVILAADTEDNHPSYVPGWWRYGSEYDRNPPELRFDWLKNLEMLLDTFEIGETRFKVTWFLRSDPPVGHRCMDAMSRLIERADDMGDELGVHIHALQWDGHSKWVQCMDENAYQDIVSTAVHTFTNHVGKHPKASRMGWNYMNNAAMQQLEASGVAYDASCVPGLQSQLTYGRRDNFFDWSRAQSLPFHPNYRDYQLPGTMRILEIPVTVYERAQVDQRGLFPKWIRPVLDLRWLASFGATVGQLSLLSPVRRAMFQDEYLSLSAWRDNMGMTKLISLKVSESLSKGWSYLLACFHPCELLSPFTGKPNMEYLRNLRVILHKILAQQDSISVIPTTLSEFGQTLQEIGNGSGGSGG